jgi:hypothetical protein
MAEDLGNGVSRTLSALQRQFQTIVWQKNKPPLDAELNLMGQIETERQREFVQAHMHSGFLLDPTQALLDFNTAAAWSDFFKFGRPAADEVAPVIWANVNGWLLPVTGTSTTEGDPSNRVDLFPPPTSDSRIDFVFLEAWVAQIAPNPSTENKPAQDKIWKWGNVKYGGTNIVDDIQDTTIGYETSERLQVQYRIRVFGSGSGLGTSVALDDFPDGMDDPNVQGQGTASSPVTGFAYTNMREALGDPGLWRAGDGDHTNELATEDGYTYAIPICAIFRRNSDPFVAQTASGTANQNGSYDRNPTNISFSDPAEGTKVLLTGTLTNAISESDTGVVEVDNLIGSGLDNAALSFPLFITIDGEIIRINAVDTGVVPATMTINNNGRGRGGTAALPHEAGASIAFYNTRMDGLYADEIAANDILDLRKGVTLGEWDHTQLLLHNLTKLVQGELRSSYKQSGSGDTQGPTVVEIDSLLANGTPPSQTEALDGPDGIRTVFSDAANIQPDVTMLLDDDAPQAGGFVTQFDASTSWDVGAGFLPGGFMNDTDGWENGSIIFLYIGGSGGGDGARGTFRGSERAVRFLGPKEYWKTDAEVVAQTPFTMSFIEEPATNPAAGDEPLIEHPGPLYPLKDQNFEKPFLVLGGLLNAESQVASADGFNDSPGAGEYEVELTGLNFDTLGDWYSLDAATDFQNDPTLVTKPVLHDSTTLYGMLTKNGQDRSGESSEIYLLLFGDPAFKKNNGVWQVVGAGTVGYTTQDASASDRIRVRAIREAGAAADFGGTPPAGITAELRSQYMHSVDGDGSTAGRAAVAVVLTDIFGTSGSIGNPWNAANLDDLRMPAAGTAGDPIPSKMVMRTTLQYHPGRGATARVADRIDRITAVNAGSEYLRQAVSTLDSNFEAQSGAAGSETYFSPVHVQTWNRLSGLGLDAPDAPSYGGEIVSFTEQDRENEAFIDSGSKTLIFRPYLDREMTLYKTDIVQYNASGGQLIPTSYPATSGGHVVDGAGIFTTAPVTVGYAVPPEFMPRFGRQDIPFHVDVTGAGTGTFLNGINHMFTDSQANTQTQFNIIGGTDAPSGGIEAIRLQTGVSSLSYGEFGSLTGGVSGYQARLYTDPTVQSSDLGRVLNGIQLPPFLGVARIYGIFDRRDYTGSAFELNRVTPVAGAPPNLLRTDADKQTLFIVEGGAADFTATVAPDYDGMDDHTYVIPDNAIDIRLSNSFVDGETFNDLEYIVVACVFGFARGWINKNTYVLARDNNGEGLSAALEPENLHMCIPAPAPADDQLYSAYVRTPYQGDPYMTRDGATRVVSDYENRYGQIAQANAFELSNSIQQFDSEGNTLVQTPNLRAVEVLASVDFYTTLGTGKVAGSLFAGTPLDIGFTENTPLASGRVPTTNTAAPWQMRSRAFSQGQKFNPSHAHLVLAITDNSSMVGETVKITFEVGTFVILIAVGGAPGVGEFQVGATSVETAGNLAAVIAADNGIATFLQVWSDGTGAVTFVALASGSEGEQIVVEISDHTVMALRVEEPVASFGPITTSSLRGGIDRIVNAGSGNSSLDLTGMTERLPLGILLQDSDFISEDPFNDGTSAMESRVGAIQPIQALIPLTQGEEYTRLVGGPGNWVGMADGGILHYEAFNESTAPTGSQSFRLFRGGGSAFVLTDPRPGGPVDWVAGRFPASQDPVLKGGVLVCKALLVRNFHEEAFDTADTVSHGDEIQMVILTRGILGKVDEQEVGVALTGSISPTGYGEGYAAADRYRLEGKPFVAGRVREAPDPNVELATFPFDDLTSNTEC